MPSLKVPLNGQFMEKANHYNKTKHKDFSMGPSVKFVLVIIDSIKKKWGLIFSEKLDTKGRGAEGFVSDATKFTCFNF